MTDKETTDSADTETNLQLTMNSCIAAITFAKLEVQHEVASHWTSYSRNGKIKYQEVEGKWEINVCVWKSECIWGSQPAVCCGLPKAEMARVQFVSGAVCPGVGTNLLKVLVEALEAAEQENPAAGAQCWETECLVLGHPCVFHMPSLCMNRNGAPPSICSSSEVKWETLLSVLAFINS